MELDRSAILLFALSAVPLLIGSAISWAARNTEIIGQLIGRSYSFTISDLIVQAIVSTTLGSIVVLALFYLMERRSSAKKMVVALVVSPVLYFASIFVGQSFLLILFKGSRSIIEAVILLVSIGVSLFSVVLIITDIIPPMARNLFVAFYGSIFGTFLGVTMVTTSMLVLVISLIFEDFLLTRYSPTADFTKMQDSLGQDPFDYTRIQSERVSVGAGDFVTYSLLAAHSLIFFPVYVWVMSMLLMLLGIFINVFVIARENELTPAIPIPAMMAVVPWVLHIFTLSVLL